MSSTRDSGSDEGALINVVARLVRLQKSLAADCKRLQSEVEGNQPLGMAPKSQKKDGVPAKESSAARKAYFAFR